MPTVHLLKDGVEISGRTMKGLPSDQADLSRWWTCVKRTFKGSQLAFPALALVYQRVEYHEASNTIRFLCWKPEYQVIIDRKRELLTS